MQQSIQRMSGQIQGMQQEVRELAQMAQMLAQQNINHYQQMHGETSNRDLFQIAGNEQSSGLMLQRIADICTHMNTHLQTISQQLGGSTQQQTQQTGAMNQNQMPPQGPIVTDTTRMDRNTAPGMEQSRLTSQAPTTNMLQGPAAQQQATATSSTANQNDFTTAPQADMTASGLGTTTMGTSVGASKMQGTIASQTFGTQMRGSTMNMQSPAQQPMQSSEQDLKNNSNVSREDPHYTQYPFNRYTT